MDVKPMCFYGCRRWGVALNLLFLAVFLGTALSAGAVKIRVASFNVYFGVGSPGDSDYNSVKAILQRINHQVFRDPPQVMENICRVTAHVQRRLAGAPATDSCAEA